MKNESSYAKKFTPLFRRMKKSLAVELSSQPLDPISQLILGFLQWDATSQAAATAFQKLMDRMVDHNDLRVSHPQEIQAIIGLRYPKAEERTRRLLMALQEIYVRQRAVSLDILAPMTKKQVRAYLDGLPAMPPYVAAQLTLLSFGGHAVPVDDALLQLLLREGVIEPDATVEEVEAFLDRRIRAGDAVEAHAILRAWVDSEFRNLSGRAKGSKKSRPAAKKTKPNQARSSPAGAKTRGTRNVS